MFVWTLQNLCPRFGAGCSTNDKGLKSLECYFPAPLLNEVISSMDTKFDSIIPDGNPEGNNTNELIDLERTKERFQELSDRFR